MRYVNKIMQSCIICGNVLSEEQDEVCSKKCARILYLYRDEEYEHYFEHFTDD